MALSMPRCTPLESLHRLPITPYLSISLNVRPVRARQRQQRAPEGRSNTQAAMTDQVRIPSADPCCKNTPLVIVPKASSRRSSRLRVKKGRQESKVDPMDMEAAEWVSRVLANNSMVEIDPMTITEQITAEKMENSNSSSPVASITSSSEAPEHFPPSSGGFPKIPYNVAFGAGSAVMLATVAVLFQALKSQKASAAPFNEPELGDSSKKTGFLGEPIKATKGASPFEGSADPSSGVPHASHVSQRGVKEVRSSKLFTDAVVSSTAGASAGAAILTTFDIQPGSVRPASTYSSMPLPPSLFKARDAHMVEKPRPNHNDRSPALDSVTPFFPSDQGPVAPQVKPKTNYQSSPSLESVPPFFPSDSSTVSQPRAPAVLDNVTPFFPDEQGTGSKHLPTDTVMPFFPDEQFKKSLNSAAPTSNAASTLDSVTPFFSSDQNTVSRAEASSALNNVTPFFSDEQAMEPGRSDLDTATPFFPSDRRSNSQANGVSSLNSVTPFFPSDRVNDSHSTNPNPASSQSHAQTNSFRKLPSKQQFKNQTGVGLAKDSAYVREKQLEVPKLLNFKDQTNQENSLQFSEQGSIDNGKVFAPIPDILSGPMSAKGEQMLAEAATKPQDQNMENRRETTEERLAARGGYVTAFNVGEAPSIENDFAYEGQDFSYAGRPAEVLSPEELALEAERKAKEKKENAKYMALQAAFPALTVGAGAVGALAGVDGALEMVGLVATASFISYELLWANKRDQLLEDINSVTDHRKLFSFLRKRGVVKEC